MSDALITVENLRVAFDTPRGRSEAVRGIDFTLGRERLGIVGESGSGKSQTGRAILKLTAPNGHVTADRMSFGETDLLAADEKRMRQIRGRHISMIMQDPKYSLNPVMPVGRQIEEACRVHGGISRKVARARALEMLEAVRIQDPRKVYDLYPHQVSGGMGQRIMIAMMLIARPEVLIADEPTSALDVSVQLQVLGLMDQLVRDMGMGLILISHDLRLVASFCDRVLVMYGGQIVERLDARDLFQAKHPYTQGLLNCMPKLGAGDETLATLVRDPEWLRERSAAHDRA